METVRHSSHDVAQVSWTVVRVASSGSGCWRGRGRGRAASGFRCSDKGNWRVVITLRIGGSWLLLLAKRRLGRRRRLGSVSRKRCSAGRGGRAGRGGC